MANKLFKSIFAVAMLLGSALGFVACEEPVEGVVGDPSVEVSATSLNFAMEEGSQSVSITANADWKVECDADWLTVTPAAGNGNGSITVAVALNDTGAIRETSIKVIALHKTYGAWDTKKIAVKQSASADVPVTETLLYGDNFDGKEATKTFGSGSSWPYIDQFPEFANASGPASENVTYSGKGVSVRANSTSNSDYSDYAGSGMNNIFFGSSAYFQINDIALNAAQANYKLTFGSEKYSQDNGSLFTNSEFHVYLSKNGNGWAEIEYTFAGTAEGRWNMATAEFTLNEVPETLYIKFSADVASSYRLDDVKLFVGNGGQSITLPEEGGGDSGDNGGSTPETGVGPYASDSIFVCAADDSVNAVYSLGATKIGNNEVTGFKLGKSKQAGKFTSGAVGVAGDKYLNFYAQGWKGGDVTLYYRVDGGATQSQKLASHDGVTGNPPYADLAFAESDHYSVKLSGLTATSTIEFSTDANFELTTADSTMASARAIVCGVKLSDEPINGEEGGETPAPTPTPGDVTTIADVLALGQGATLNGSIECVVISNYELNNLTSKKGMYVQDETGALQFYLAANHEFAFGTKVQIDLTGATLGAYNGAVQVSGLALEKISVVSTGNTVAPKSVTMADFLANKYEGQYISLSGVQVADADLSKTWVMDGAHTSITMEDASGNNFVVFSSKYATYGADAVAQGSGVIKGISSINNGNMQIIFAQASDYAGLTGARFDGTTTPTPEPEPTPSEVVKATVAEFLAAAEDDTIYELTGEITSVTNTTYGNFYLKDSTGEVLIYGLCSPTGEAKYWEASGVKVGDTITVQTVRTSYNGTAQGKNAIYISHVAGEGTTDPEPTPEPGDVFVITFPGNPSKYTNSYTDSFTIEVGSNAFVFSGINNGQESNAWTAVRFGRKANDSVATIATSNAISYAVSSVKINFTQVDTEMNSAKLIVASDSDFTNVVEEVTAELAVGEVVYTVTSPAENLYYKLEYDMPSTGTNGSYRFDKVTYAK